MLKKMILMCLLATVTAPVLAAKDKGFHVHDLWIREAPPGFTILAAYLNFENHGDQTVVVKNVSSPDFARVEMHMVKEEGGQTSMIALEQMEVPANGHISLKPGGSHLMLYDPTRPLKHGDEAQFEFTLGDGKKLKVKAKVKKVLGKM